MKTEIPFLEKKTEGVLVNTDQESFSNYMKRKTALDRQDNEVQHIRGEINSINNRLDSIVDTMGTLTNMLQTFMNKGT